MLRKPKGPTARARAAKTRRDGKVAAAVRADIEERNRDGACRFFGLVVDGFPPCGGQSEWAHLEAKRRFQTRGQDPTVRHTVEDTMKLCTVHHRLYDAHGFSLVFQDAEHRAELIVGVDVCWPSGEVIGTV